MRKFYYLFSIVLFFLSIQSTLAQSGCSDLEVTSVQDGSVCGGGSVFLEATTSGTGDGVFWYNAETGGELVGQGDSFYTPEISTTSSFWTTEANFTGGTDQVGPMDPSVGDTNSSSIDTHSMNFDVLEETTLSSVDIFPSGTIGDQSSVLIRDSNKNVLYDIPYTTTVTGGATAQTITLNAHLMPGQGYQLAHGSRINLTRNTSGASYPYTSSKINITGNSFNTGYIIYYYNWTYIDLEVDCESPRVEAIAAVNNIADENVAALPYTHSANTGAYDNNYIDVPGADCGTDDHYLYGSDVVYKYTADDDYILIIQLSDLSESFTGVFVYEDCEDIGNFCTGEGSVNSSFSDHGFQLSVEEGKDYYFVISSLEPIDVFDYTLNIAGSTCANYPVPIADGAQSFVDGQLLMDLAVDGEELIWYSDAALSNVLSGETSLIDNTTYYVTQTFDSCESAALAITVSKAPCSALEVVATEASSVCGEGVVSLSAQGAEDLSKTVVYWYDSETNGELMGTGNNFITPNLEQSTSYWVAEVAVSGEDVLHCESDRVEVIAEVNEVADEVVDEPLPYAHTSNTKDYGNNYFGEPGGDCTSHEYLNGSDVVYQFSPSVGAVYSIELSGLSSDNVGVFVYENCFDIGDLCYAGAISDGNSKDFGIDEIALNNGQDYFIVISTNTLSSTDYTLTIDEAHVDCTDYTDAPIGDDDQYADIGSSLSDLDVKGANLTWYSDSTLNPGNELSSSTLVVDNETYFVTQTLNGCESDYSSVIVHEIDCSGLEITNTEDALIVCKGSATIAADGSGSNEAKIFWYDKETGGDVIHQGTSFTIPEITQTTSYWVNEVLVDGVAPFEGQAKETYNASSGSSLANYGLLFDAYESFKIMDVEVYPTSSGGDITVQLIEESGTVIEEKVVAIPSGSSTPAPFTISLDFEVPEQGTYRLISKDRGVSMVRETSSNNSFPYALGDLGEITSGSTKTSTSSSYYWFYNWTIGSGEEVICESSRAEVEVEVSQDGNEVVNSLPYTHSENTGTYGNNYTGKPGSNCGVDENYLNGSDVVYMYEATDDDLITIELKDLDEKYAGIFIYDDCNQIGDTCAVGSIAGPSTDDVIIQYFPVEEGVIYYIVVSSWLTSDIDYTIEMNSFSCADLEEPVGEVLQYFASGDTVADLDAEETRSGATLTWYEDSALSLEIVDISIHDLVDGSTYYVTQDLNNCESLAHAIVVEEIDCSALEIVGFTEAEVACRGSVVLEAEASGTGSEIHWYDASSGGSLVGVGSTFITSEITETTSYWATEVYLDESSGIGTSPELIYLTFNEEAPILNHATSPVGNNPVNLIGSGLTVGGSGLSGMTLIGTGDSSSSSRIDTGWNTNLSGSFTVGFWTSEISTNSSITYIFGDSGSGNFRCFTNGAAGANNWQVRGGGLPNLDITGAATMDPNYIHIVYDSDTGEYSSYVDGVLNTTVQHTPGHTFPTGSGFTIGGQGSSNGLNGKLDEFRVYDRALTSTEMDATFDTMISGDVICSSPRQEVVARIDQSGDMQFDYTDLPFEDVNNTSLFGNNFSGDVGDGCVGSEYLDGYEAMYYYEADKNDDDILHIELSDVDNPNAGVFIYQSCGYVGVECLAGATMDNGKVTIDDLYVDAGDDLLIVVSASSGTVDYTLSINGIDCSDVDSPTGEVAPSFMEGNFISDLAVYGSDYNKEFIWYRDIDLTDEITDPSSEVLIDGSSYYVTQTILGCESLALKITPLEFQCGDMEATPTQSEYYVCSPGGEVILDANSSGLGGNVYWYDAATDGNTVGRGDKITLDVDETTDVWVTEVFLGGEAVLSGQGKTDQESSVLSSSKDYGLRFNSEREFTLHSVDVYPGNKSNDLTISLYDGNGDLLDSKQVSVTSPNNDPVTVILDFNVPKGQGMSLLEDGGNSTTLGNDISSYAHFPYDIGYNGQITGGADDSTGSSNTNYYYFYNWSIVEVGVICESPREKVKVEVNDEVTARPVFTPVQNICGDGLLSDLKVLGYNIKWYNSSGTNVSPNSQLIEGEVYYVTQTINACESDMQEVIINFSEKSEAPVAATNQVFVTGDDLAALEVHGDDLTWYVDEWMTEELSPTTELINQTTYYVTQVQEDKCESLPLGIKVHETLDIKDLLFEQFDFYPNPVDEILYISNSKTIEEIKIFDLAGKKVYTQKYQDNNIKLDVSHLSTGTYLMKAKVDKMEKIFRVVKM